MPQVVLQDGHQHCLTSTSYSICGAFYVICGAFYIICSALYVILYELVKRSQNLIINTGALWREEAGYCYALGQTDNCMQDGGSTKELY